MNQFARAALAAMVMLGASVSCAAAESAAKQLLPLLPKMTAIVAGSFRMGDDSGEGDANELPVHSVAVPAFAISTYEVTFELYDYFAAATGRKLPGDEGWGRGSRPVTNVSWYDAKALAAWLSKQTGRSFRLPSEAEWEYAARAGTTTAFPNGNTLTRDYANYGPLDCCVKGTGQSGRDSFDFSAPVGSFLPNPWGLYDMLGNVWEWTEDCWNENYQGAPADGKPWAAGSCSRSPLRGGSWTHYSRNLRSANRNDNARESSGNGYGIRLAEDTR